VNDEPLPAVEGLAPPKPVTRCEWCGIDSWLYEVEVEPPMYTSANGVRRVKRHGIYAKACGPCKRRLESRMPRDQ
jgi:hypothetical protein